MKKCLLYALSFAVLLIGLFISFSDDTHAAAGWNALECPASSTTVPELDFDWVQLMQERFETQHPNETWPGLTSDSVYMMGQYTQDSAQMRMILLLDPDDDEIIFRKTDPPSSQYQAFISPGARYVQYGINGTNMPGTQPGTIQLGTPIQTAHATNGSVFISFYCHHGSRGITYDSSWDIGEYNDYNPTPDDSCDTWDIPCHIAKIGEKIGDAFTGIVEGIATALTWLFVPDGAAFQALFDELMDFFSEKLGFLFYPFDVFRSVFERFGVDNGSSPTLANLCLGGSATFFGQSFCIRTNGGNLLISVRPILQALVAIALVHGFRSKYKSVVHK